MIELISNLNTEAILYGRFVFLVFRPVLFLGVNQYLEYRIWLNTCRNQNTTVDGGGD